MINFSVVIVTKDLAKIYRLTTIRTFTILLFIEV